MTQSRDTEAGGGARTFRLEGGFTVWAEPDVPEAWAIEVCREVADRQEKRWRRPGPGATPAFVKVYRPRSRRGWVRRLGRGREAVERDGYRTFARLGLPSADLLLTGERRVMGLRRYGFVATRYVDAVHVERRLRDGAGEELVMATARVLARIHAAGLVHGDPLLRNFLDHPPEPMPIDLGSYGPSSPAAHREDLVRFLGSTVRAVGRDVARRGLLAYRDGERHARDDALIERAVVYAAEKEERHQRKRARRQAET